MSQVIRISKPNRPLSVSLLIVGNVFIAIILLAKGFKGVEWGYPVWQAASWAILALAISTSSFLAWMGSRYARNALLAALTLYLGLLFLQSVQTIIWANNWSYDDRYTTQSAYWAAFSVVWLAANWWLLLSRRARMFFA
jgi:hypothetical protein